MIKYLILIIFSCIIFTETSYSKNIVPYTSIPHLDTSIYYLNKGVKEKTGNNDGKEVEMFLRYVGLPKGNPWCASFVSYCLGVSKGVLLKVRSALAQRFITRTSISAKDALYGSKEIKPGYLAIWKHGGTISGHIGNVYVWGTYKGQTVEGNAGNKVSFMERRIEPRNYFRIVSFTAVEYEDYIQERVDRYIPKWYKKTDNNRTNESVTF